MEIAIDPTRQLEAEVADLKARLEAARLRAERAEADNAVLRDGSADSPAIPDGEPWPDVLAYVEGWARAWSPDARLLGKARAQDIARACREAVEYMEANACLEET